MLSQYKYRIPQRIPSQLATPITLSNNIVDVSGVSLRQFWNLKSHMQSASQLATAHYPETLDRMSCCYHFCRLFRRFANSCS